MTDKEFRKLSRRELIEIIYQLQCEQQALTEENQKLQEALDDRILKQQEYGSIAQAAVGLSDIFSLAQETADRYLESIYAANKNPQQMIDEAKQKAAEILSGAQKEAEEIRAQAERDVEERWTTINKKINDLLRARGVLDYLSTGEEK